MGVKINIVKKVSLKNPTLIEGFPGMGLVGTISASYLVEKFNMDFIGYVSSEHFPPLAAIHDHKPLFPARLYASKKHNMIVLVSEFVIPIRSVHALADAIYDLAKKKKVSQIISLGAIVQKGEQGKIFAVASVENLQKKLDKDPKVQLVKEGVTTGVTGVLLARGALEKFPVVSFLSQASSDYMDPMASVSVLRSLKDYLGLKKLDISDLENDAKSVESKMKSLLQHAKKNAAHYEKASKSASIHDDFGDSMYR